MAIKFLRSTKQDRVDEMLRWLHNIPEYEKSPTNPKFLEDRQWADAIIDDMRKKNKFPGKAEAKEALEDMLPSIKKTTALYRDKWDVLLGNTATADASHIVQEKSEKFNTALAKIRHMTAALEEIEKETQQAYDAVVAWCDDRASRRVSGLYAQTIGPVDEEIAEMAIRKFFERRGEISQATDSHCFVFTQLLGGAVKDRKIKGSALLDAHRNAYQKIRLEQKRSEQNN